MPKIFVLDTNIILHDHNAIRQFQDNDLVIPIAVIEELDKFKKGNDALSFNARAFMRDINKLTEKREFGPEGISLGKRLGNIKIEPNHPFAPDHQGHQPPAQGKSRGHAGPGLPEGPRRG